MDAFCLHALIREAQPALRGAKIIRVLQPDRWSLLLVFQRGRGPGGLLLSVKPGALRFELVSPPRDLPRVPSRFGGVVSSRLKGALVEGIEQVGLERIVAVHLKGTSQPEVTMTLYAEMLGPRGNFVLADRATGRIIDRLRSPSRSEEDRVSGRGELYQPLFDRGRIDPRSVGEDEFVELVGSRLAEGVEPARVLISRFTGLGPVMAVDLVARAGLLPNISAVKQARSLWKPFYGLIERVAAGRFEPRLLVGDDGHPDGLAAFPLASVPVDRQVPYSTMSEAAHDYHAGRGVVSEHDALRASLLRRLRAGITRAVRLSAKLAQESASYDQADLHARRGQLLLANRAVIRRGERMVELADHADPIQRIVQIELDPSCSLEDNAKRYFSLHRKAKRGAELVSRRSVEVASRLAKLRDLVRRTEATKELEELQHIESALTPLARRQPPQERRSPDIRRSEGPEPRVFRSSDGLPILVGKSGAGNDRLTWRLARSHDLWLHAQGIPGSHVLVRLEKGKGVPPHTLREAALLAAYYSRARGQVKVPVDYALRKYLRKPKAAAPGLVLLSQEKTIVVRPDRDLVRRLHPSKRDSDTEA